MTLPVESLITLASSLPWPQSATQRYRPPGTTALPVGKSPTVVKPPGGVKEMPVAGDPELGADSPGGDGSEPHASERQHDDSREREGDGRLQAAAKASEAVSNHGAGSDGIRPGNVNIS